uniref:Uncharacterized protein n=1 Tax=Arthrobacter sp. AK-1 TaxID=415095 RepID=A6YFE9_9MICC|nr:unknown [Arthrobacter sp. AK-1]
MFPGDSTQALPPADISGQEPAGAQEEEDAPVAAGVTAPSADVPDGWEWEWLEGRLSRCRVDWAAAAGMVYAALIWCAPVMMCMPKIPAMMARAAVRKPVRRRNAVKGPRDGAVTAFPPFRAGCSES